MLDVNMIMLPVDINMSHVYIIIPLHFDIIYLPSKLSYPLLRALLRSNQYQNKSQKHNNLKRYNAIKMYYCLKSFI